MDFAKAERGDQDPGKYLRALEDEQFELLPGRDYVKGFLRTYADYLGLDGQLYVDEYNSRFGSGEEPSAARQPCRRARPQRRNRRIETSVVLFSLAAIAVVTVDRHRRLAVRGTGRRTRRRARRPRAGAAVKLGPARRCAPSAATTHASRPLRLREAARAGVERDADDRQHAALR